LFSWEPCIGWGPDPSWEGALEGDVPAHGNLLTHGAACDETAMRPLAKLLWTVVGLYSVLLGESLDRRTLLNHK